MLSVLFGLETNEAAVLVMARHWMLLFVLVGGLLIYAGYHPEARTPILIVGAVENSRSAAS